ncbi:ankyrin repeat domain-containing protein 17-like [Coregonus clupeaformis]|uniref:ankyrin repeat domain-containing protein 17-like n=1 Tax=Coregonus clupeaformis TaxID=59861 RepID=UPI001BE0E6B5|nr:ankyrin repeat domain-containing protein 17-like [Coregonus clupeaformis]
MVSYLLNNPNNILSVPAPNLQYLSSHDTSQAPRVTFQALSIVEPDRVPSNITTPPPIITKSSKQRLSPLQGNPFAADGPDRPAAPLPLVPAPGAHHGRGGGQAE